MRSWSLQAAERRVLLNGSVCRLQSQRTPSAWTTTAPNNVRQASSETLLLLEAVNTRTLAELSSVRETCSPRRSCGQIHLSSSSREGSALAPRVSDAVASTLPLLRESICTALSLRSRHGSVTDKGRVAEDDTAALEGRRLSHVDLSNLKLSASFNRCELSFANLESSTFRKCTFHLTVMNRCSLFEASFHTCMWVGAEAQSVDARRARFAKCVFHRCDFREWNVAGAVFIDCEFRLCNLGWWKRDSQTMLMGQSDKMRQCSKKGWS